MNRSTGSGWGCVGLLAGGLIGLFLAGLIFWMIQPAGPVATIQPAIPAGDVTLFLSERTLSRIASAAMAEPTMVDCRPGGQMEVTTRTNIAGLKLTVDLGLSLDLQEGRVISRLEWAGLSFLKIPAGWLPQEIVEMAALPGQTINQQIPPQFTLAGLNTGEDGINFQLNWNGQPF